MVRTKESGFDSCATGNLFICSLFNDDVSISDYAARNDRMINQLEGRRCGLT
jgi:hypothetical protein